MDRQSIVLYLSRKGLSAVAIHDDLVATLGAKAVSYPSVTRYLHEVIFASSNPPDPLPPPEHQLDDSDQVILLALANQPLASIRELSRLTHRPRTTVHRRLTQSLGLRVNWLSSIMHKRVMCLGHRIADSDTVGCQFRPVSKSTAFPTSFIFFQNLRQTDKLWKMSRISISPCERSIQTTSTNN
jgi:hypothetical protein